VDATGLAQQANLGVAGNVALCILGVLPFGHHPVFAHEDGAERTVAAFVCPDGQPYRAPKVVGIVP
jgi:hypothetical protein